MPKVDFYILEASQQKSLFFACQLLEKFYLNQQSVYVQVASLKAAEELNALLWTFRDDSFVPHELYKPDASFAAPIQIGYKEESPKQAVLLNLTTQIPACFAQSNHIIEIVFADPTVQQLAREKFKQYRDNNCELTTYKIKANEV